MGLRNMKGPIDLGTFSTNTESEMISSADFRTATVTLSTVGFTGTINFFASNSDRTGDEPDLSAVASPTNSYSAVRSIDLDSGDPIAGSTGIPLIAETSETRFELNDNNNNWIGIKTSGVTLGTIKVTLDFVDNE